MSTTTQLNTPRKFYVQGAAGLAVSINKPTRVLENGNSKVIGGDMVEFHPMGFNSDFGELTTSNPEIIAVLEKRPDVFGPDELNRRMMTPEARAKQLETVNTRLVTEKNRLLEEIAELKKNRTAAASADAANPLLSTQGQANPNPTSKKG